MLRWTSIQFLAACANDSSPIGLNIDARLRQNKFVRILAPMQLLHHAAVIRKVDLKIYDSPPQACPPSYCVMVFSAEQPISRS